MGEYVVNVPRLPAHQVEGWPELVRRLYDKLQELDRRAVLNASRRRYSERFGILPNTAMETPGSTPCRHNGDLQCWRAEDRRRCRNHTSSPSSDGEPRSPQTTSPRKRPRPRCLETERRK